jgi:hypothetical protein
MTKKTTYPKVKHWFECAILAIKDQGATPDQLRMAIIEVTGFSIKEQNPSDLTFPVLDTWPELEKT